MPNTKILAWWLSAVISSPGSLFTSAATYWIFFMILKVSVITRISGINGFVLLLPLFILGGSYTMAGAIPVIQSIILFGGLTAVGFDLKQKHPIHGGPIVSINIIKMVAPGCIFGAFFGTLVNDYIPEVVLITVLLVVSLFLAFRMAFFGVSCYKNDRAIAERPAFNEVPLTAELHSEFLARGDIFEKRNFDRSYLTDTPAGAAASPAIEFQVFRGIARKSTYSGRNPTDIPPVALNHHVYEVAESEIELSELSSSKRHERSSESPELCATERLSLDPLTQRENESFAHTTEGVYKNAPELASVIHSSDARNGNASIDKKVQVSHLAEEDAEITLKPLKSSSSRSTETYSNGQYEDTSRIAKKKDEASRSAKSKKSMQHADAASSSDDLVATEFVHSRKFLQNYPEDLHHNVKMKSLRLPMPRDLSSNVAKQFSDIKEATSNFDIADDNTTGSSFNFYSPDATAYSFNASRRSTREGSIVKFDDDSQRLTSPLIENEAGGTLHEFSKLQKVNHNLRIMGAHTDESHSKSKPTGKKADWVFPKFHISEVFSNSIKTPIYVNSVEYASGLCKNTDNNKKRAINLQGSPYTMAYSTKQARNFHSDCPFSEDDESPFDSDSAWPALSHEFTVSERNMGVLYVDLTKSKVISFLVHFSVLLFASTAVVVLPKLFRPSEGTLVFWMAVLGFCLLVGIVQLLSLIDVLRANPRLEGLSNLEVTAAFLGAARGSRFSDTSYLFPRSRGSVGESLLLSPNYSVMSQKWGFLVPVVSIFGGFISGLCGVGSSAVLTLFFLNLCDPVIAITSGTIGDILSASTSLVHFALLGRLQYLPETVIYSSACVFSMVFACLLLWYLQQRAHKKYVSLFAMSFFSSLCLVFYVVKLVKYVVEAIASSAI